MIIDYRIGKKKITIFIHYIFISSGVLCVCVCVCVCGGGDRCGWYRMGARDLEWLSVYSVRVLKGGWERRAEARLEPALSWELYLSTKRERSRRDFSVSFISLGSSLILFSFPRCHPVRGKEKKNQKKENRGEEKFV